MKRAWRMVTLNRPVGGVSCLFVRRRKRDGRMWIGKDGDVRTCGFKKIGLVPGRPEYRVNNENTIARSAESIKATNAGAMHI